MTFGSVRLRHEVVPKATLHAGWSIFLHDYSVREEGVDTDQGRVLRPAAATAPILDFHLSVEVQPRWDVMVGTMFMIGDGAFIHPTVLVVVLAVGKSQ